MNIKYITSFFMILAILGIIYVSYTKYRSEIISDLENKSLVQEKTKQDENMRLLFDKNKLTSSRYQIIADKNIFTEDREAWMPPPPPPPAKTPEAAPPPPVKPPDPINPSDLSLYGTYVSKGDNYAIVQFNRFLSPRKRKIIKEGDEVHDDNQANESVFYTVKSITPSKAVIADNLKREITLDLFESRKNVDKSYALRSMSAEDKEKLAAQGVLEKINTPFGNSFKNPNDVAQKQKKLIDKYKKKYPEKEKLVEQGKLKRIITPFGPSYRKVN